jgi:hypothetical protein
MRNPTGTIFLGPRQRIDRSLFLLQASLVETGDSLLFLSFLNEVICSAHMLLVENMTIDCSIALNFGDKIITDHF